MRPPSFPLAVNLLAAFFIACAFWKKESNDFDIRFGGDLGLVGLTMQECGGS